MLRRHIQTVRDALECESSELLGTDNELPTRLVGAANRGADFRPLTKDGPSANTAGFKGRSGSPFALIQRPDCHSAAPLSNFSKSFQP